MFAELRERFEKMSPEEREKARSQMGGRFQRQGEGQSGGQGFAGGGGAMLFRGEGGSMTGDQPSGPRVRRQAQIGNASDVRWRIAMVKEGNEFKPRIIKIGPNNFDNSEVLDGLKEGEEVQITSISRAKLASEQMNERMRSMNSMGGLGGGGTRGAGR